MAGGLVRRGDAWRFLGRGSRARLGQISLVWGKGGWGDGAFFHNLTGAWATWRRALALRVGFRRHVRPCFVLNIFNNLHEPSTLIYALYKCRKL